ncbi:MAG: hypothetical protein FJ317_03990 [SAR202 cluster bacterium]|nr:hypothetical protein [SAR202 cluster bacterium]
MDWGNVIWIAMSAGGAALLVGGLITYLKGTRTAVKAAGGAATATGFVLLAIAVAVAPVTRTTSGSPEPVVEYELR